MKTSHGIALLIILSTITVMGLACKKESIAPTEDWCATCQGNFPQAYRSYDFNSQYCGTKKQVDNWVEEKYRTGAGRIRDYRSYINCNKYKAK